MEYRRSRRRLVSFFAAFSLGVLACSVQAQETSAAREFDPQALADQVQSDVAELRGLPFKRRVKAELQSVNEFGAYVDKELGQEVPPNLVRYYGKYIRKLGLYNGPEITDGRGMMKMVMTSQAGAYYDPDKQTFFVLMSNMPELMLGSLCAHELYHGLQDQYFNLNSYVLNPVRQHRLNSDEALARQSVVEGEATYLMTLWMLKKATGKVPSRDLLTMAVQQQANIDMEMFRAALKNPAVAQMMGSDMQTAMAAAEKIPPFMFDALVGAYLKGLGFVYAVQEKGWSEVEKLYKSAPPQSSEQILHPEKWFAQEAPLKIEWQSFAGPELRNWELLDADVLGEFRWRSVFKAQGMPNEANALASGWDGDRYAVLKRRDSDELLLLLSTAWDSDADAAKFAEGYRKALASKYADEKVATKLVVQGKQVWVVEGGAERDLDALMTWVSKAKTTRAQ